ncbi:hypothetical protein AGLY_013663 [Aphis glycines]|uniref:Uncharacterized protein n=1 Tax=Aphis glycines TaxID=307491 RepID=A0A6G0T941_APHGL|nr:hypothetical protein AGLY_013663 [Aphis glycines]
MFILTFSTIEIFNFSNDKKNPKSLVTIFFYNCLKFEFIRNMSKLRKFASNFVFGKSVDKIFLVLSKYLKILYKVPHMHNILLAFKVQILTKIRQNYEYLQIIFPRSTPPPNVQQNGTHLPTFFKLFQSHNVKYFVAFINPALIVSNIGQLFKLCHFNSLDLSKMNFSNTFPKAETWSAESYVIVQRVLEIVSIFFKDNKHVIICLIIPFMASWTLIYFATAFWMLYVAHLITGSVRKYKTVFDTKLGRKVFLKDHFCRSIS